MNESNQIIFDHITKAIENMKNKGWETRYGQETLMYDVFDAYDSRENLIVEAQVGIGKSFGYLIPGILISKSTKKPLIVTTSSIQLTEQLVNDIQQVEEILHISVDCIVGKGVTNYPCFKEIHRKNLSKLNLMEALDIANNGLTKQTVRETNLKWNQISTNNCIMSKCHYKNECAYFKMRNKLKEGNRYIRLNEYKPKVIIVNQDMLMMNFKKLTFGKESLIYDDPCMLIVDEVHNLEEKQRANMTKTINSKTVINKIKEGANRVGSRSRYLKNIKMIEDWFNLQKDSAKSEIYKNGNCLSTGRVDIKPVSHHQMAKLISMTKEIVEEFDVNNIVVFKQSSLVSNEQLEIANNLLTLFKNLQNNSDKYIFWTEITKQDQIDISFCPNNIAETLRKTVFSTSYPVVCLSATITNKTNNENSYEYIKEIIGFKGYEEDIKYNDFPYKESRLYIPPNLPKFDKRDVKYYEEIGKHIFELASQNKGGTLILFTAKDDIDGVYNDLSKRKFNKTIYVDDGSKSQNEIIESFKKTKGVILGTGVFWEGIDLKNELLTLLVIVRLPFPTIDPITKYKITKLNDSNEAVIVPEMIIKLKQGVGRLVRTKQDKGLLVLLDSRMNKPIYKHKEAVLDALPIKNMIHKDEVKDFLNNI
ncbi:TPA: ATP-dependent DNA helicase [Staphylococcus aureus]|uniref:DEAD/DEAH box helicase domain protein n=2 Tax=Staphylococcus aureus TaxID=1280 RepID=A0A2S1FUL4_STAAU|nr:MULTISPECIES: ATP-dependent DNA helicase [Staphylococcus]MBN4935035.1 ATP-dependent DNA helicase [Staphylococcus sp. EG-SA-6]HAR6210924.1 ATP-dependent DNA helicase [Staphylococcus pseudintermedius]HDH6261844.1 ATP-dependent DNA helicase [Staphylococcus aureus LTCF-9-32]AWD76440.1 DEAD/DEAH box helicase domain protein [Staphylococcus aureus]EGQ1569655.1 ATP-dependent DNA helicase [Staphylococcus aureus]